MRIKRIVLRAATTTAAVALLSSCGTGGDGGEGSASEADDSSATGQSAPAYGALNDVIDVVASTADCGTRWDVKTRSQAPDSYTGMPAVDYSYQECSMAEGDDESPIVTVYFAQLDGSSDEIVQALKVDLTVSDSYLIQGDKWVVQVAQDSDSDEGAAYSEELADSLKSALDENAQVTYKGDA